MKKTAKESTPTIFELVGGNRDPEKAEKFLKESFSMEEDYDHKSEPEAEKVVDGFIARGRLWRAWVR